MKIKFVIRDTNNNTRFITLDEFHSEFPGIKLQFNKGYLIDVPFFYKNGLLQILIEEGEDK